MATIDEFLNLDIRVGKVIAVSELNTRKPMYGLKVDLGELGVRNIAAGIKSSYTAEELSGRSVVVVANLDPKNVGGFVSEGMLLAVGDTPDSITLLKPDKDVKQGSRVR